MRTAGDGLAGFAARLILVGALLVGVVGYSLRPGGYLTGTELAHVVAIFSALDEMTVEAAPPLAVSNVDVFWNATAAEGTPMPVQVVKAGEVVAAIPRWYGENDLEIRYGGRSVSTILHFKRAGWHYHAYRIELQPRSGGLPSAELKAAGPDAHLVWELATMSARRRAQ